MFTLRPKTFFLELDFEPSGMGGGAWVGGWGGGGGSWPLRRPKKILRIRGSLTLQNGIPESGFWCQKCMYYNNYVFLLGCIPGPGAKPPRKF